MTQSEKNQDRRCPACEGTNLVLSFENIDAICEDCCFVIADFSSVELPEQLKTEIENPAGSEQDQKEEWVDYVSVTDSTEQRMVVTLQSLESISSEVGLSSEIRSCAAEILGTAAKENRIDGHRTEVVVGAILYWVARDHGEAVPQTAMARAAGTRTPTLGDLTRSLQVELELEHTGVQPDDYLSYLKTELGCDDSTVNQAKDIIQDADQSGLVDAKSPTGIAGAALFCSCGGQYSQRTVAQTAGVSEETIRLRIKEFREEGLVDG